jgi:hypothetical protein
LLCPGSVTLVASGIIVMMYDDVHCRRGEIMATATWMAILWGCIGGALPDVFRLIQGRHGQVPTYLGSAYFWISLVLLVVVGGVTAWGAASLGVTPAGAAGPANWGVAETINAVSIGYSAPSLLSKLFSEAPVTRDIALARPRSLRGWWAK